MMEKRKQWKGFTDFQLKWLALVLMVFDHIHYFFEFTGKVPEWFSMLGRLSAPLFLFCLLEGFAHTRNRKKYFLRIYAIAVGMGALQYVFLSFVRRPDGFVPQNQMLATFSILLVILQGIEWCRQRQWLKGLCAVLLPLLWPCLLYTSDIRVTGLDLKKEVIRHCQELADKYGYEGLEFLQGDIADYSGEEKVDMVVTLHACDTATDYACLLYTSRCV